MSTLLFWTQLGRLSLSGLLAKLQLENFAGQVAPAKLSAGGGCLGMETSATWGGGCAPSPFGPNRGQTPDI